MARVRRYATPLIVLLAVPLIVIAQMRMDHIRATLPEDELLYMPNQKLLDNCTAGMDSVIADFLWIKCIQYTARHFKGDGRYTWLNHMFEMITELDPYFVAAYRYGAIFLAGLKADDTAGINLLHKGMVRNPFAWELPYEVAVTYLLNRGDQPDSPIHAAHYMAISVETGNAPQFVMDIANGLQSAQNLNDLQRAMWMHTRESGDPFVRQLADRKLAELAIRETCDAIDRLCTQYASRTGAPPKRIEDLVAAQLLPGIPTDSLGGSFFLDPNGKTQNTTLLDDQVVKWRNALRGVIESYHLTWQQWPQSLQELVDTGLLAQMPAYPYPGKVWQYDPATGEVQ